MKAPILTFIATMLCVTAAFALEPAKAEIKDTESKIQLEQTVFGHLRELNGIYKLRLTETTYPPGAHVGKHHHAGPGIRLVKSGQLTYVFANKTTIYKSGEYFYESGDITHEVFNKGKLPVKIVNFEILPAGLVGSSIMLPTSR